MTGFTNLLLSFSVYVGIWSNINVQKEKLTINKEEKFYYEWLHEDFISTPVGPTKEPVLDASHDRCSSSGVSLVV